MEERSKKIVWGLSDLRWFDKGVEWKVGKGDKIKFWCDACGKNKTLPIYIPDFSSFHCENLTKLTIWGGGTWRWEFSWCRNCFAWEKDLLREFQQLVSSMVIDRERLDGSYSVKTTYNLIIGNDGNQQTNKIFGARWKLNIPPKVIFFFFLEIVLEQAGHFGQLKKKNVSVAANNWLCPKCSLEETTAHILFSCKLADSVLESGIFMWKALYCLPLSA